MYYIEPFLFVKAGQLFFNRPREQGDPPEVAYGRLGIGPCGKAPVYLHALERLVSLEALEIRRENGNVDAFRCEAFCEQSAAYLPAAHHPGLPVFGDEKYLHRYL